MELFKVALNKKIKTYEEIIEIIFKKSLDSLAGVIETLMTINIFLLFNSNFKHNML